MREADGAPLTLRIDLERWSRRVLFFCILVEIAFVVCDYYFNYGRPAGIGAIRRLFNIAREDGLASWFGVAQTLLAGLTLWAIYGLVRQHPGAGWRAAGWLVLASFFTYMAVDDGAQLHERLGTAYRVFRQRSASGPSFFPSYPWQILFVPLFGALGVFTLGFLWRELERGSRIILLCAMAGFALAVGLDFIEGLDPAHPWNVYARISEHISLDLWTERRFQQPAYETLRHFSKSIEEALEMLSNSLCWFLFLRHLGAVTSELRLRFRG